MDHEKSLERFREYIKKCLAINYAETILSWDAQTEAPRSSSKVRGESLGYFTLLGYDLLVNDQMKEDLEILITNIDNLSEVDVKMVKDIKKYFDKASKIPAKEMEEYKKLLNRSQHSWADAREKSDFSLFAPDLKEIIETLKKFAKYRDDSKHPYDIYLDDYEEGMTREELDKFFSVLRERVVPLIKKIQDSGKVIRKDFLSRKFDMDKQRELAKETLEILKFDLSRGVLKESTHPFTMGANIDDVRLTSRYSETDIMSGILSVAHEGGHALYEQNVARELDGTTLRGGTSLGIHESQSRIYENNIFKSREFSEYFFKVLKRYFPYELDDVTFEEYYNGIHISEPSFIRVDADELTYPLHIMIRYEIEIGLIEGSIDVDELPVVWNRKMKEYLGITPGNDAMGVLQDVHWSFGLFGYFPTYALGSAYAAQFFDYMSRDIDISEALKNGDMDKPLDWLREKIHKHGSLYNPVEISLKSTGEKLNPEYFCNYLEEKFSKVYGL